MTWETITVLVLGGSAALLLLSMAARLARYRRSSSPPEGEIRHGFSLARYEPMERLLSEEDFEFLAAQPGYTQEIGKRFKSEGRRIFRLYLEDLAQDFHELHAKARAAVADAGEQHAELVGVLLRQHLQFWLAIGMIEARMTLGPVWISAEQVRSLTHAVDAMRIDLARFAPTPAA